MKWKYLLVEELLFICYDAIVTNTKYLCNNFVIFKGGILK